MATFYLLPTRPCLADHLADLLQPILPGVDLNVSVRRRLLDGLLDELLDDRDVILVPRDELPRGEAAEKALVEGFGASPGDEVIDVRPGSRTGEFRSHRWCIGEVARQLV